MNFSPQLPNVLNKKCIFGTLNQNLLLPFAFSGALDDLDALSLLESRLQPFCVSEGELEEKGP